MGTIASLLILVLWLFVIVVLVRVVFSWVNPSPRSYGGRSYGRRSSGFLATVSDLAYRITEPVLAPVRRWVPPVSGMDLSPLVVTVACYFLINALGYVN
jgi:YggT family protein